MMIERRPWGFFEVLASGPSWTVKRLVVAPGAMTSLQVHAKRDEIWTVVEGSGLARIGPTQDYQLEIGSAGLTIPAGTVHRIYNNSDLALTLIEVWRGECDENDITRIADAYGRAGK